MRNAGEVSRAGDVCRAGDVTWTPTNVDRDSVCLALRTNGRLNLKAFIDRPRTINPPINRRAPGARGYTGFSVGLQLEQEWKLESLGTQEPTSPRSGSVFSANQVGKSSGEWKTPLSCVSPSSWWCMNLGSLSKSESYFCFTVLVGRGISSTFHLAFPSPNLLLHTSENQCLLLRMSLQSKDSSN